MTLKLKKKLKLCRIRGVLTPPQLPAHSTNLVLEKLFIKIIKQNQNLTYRTSGLGGGNPVTEKQFPHGRHRLKTYNEERALEKQIHLRGRRAESLTVNHSWVESVRRSSFPLEKPFFQTKRTHKIRSMTHVWHLRGEGEQIDHPLGF